MRREEKNQLGANESQTQTDISKRREQEITFPTDRNASGREGSERGRSPSETRERERETPYFGGGGTEREEAPRGTIVRGGGGLFAARASGLK